MRILVVTNYYPPHFFGGYELGCRDVVEGLRQRGHDVKVLTSDYHAPPVSGEDAVMRVLPLESGQGGWRLFLRSVAKFQRALNRHRPEIVYFWNQAGLCYWLAPVARTLGYRSAFFISDTSFRSWRVGAFLRRYFSTPDGLESRSFLVRGYPVTHGGHCQFASRFLLQMADRDPREQTSRVVHWGIDAHLFTPPLHDRRPSSPMRILFVGQIIPEKGVDTLVDAVAHLLRRRPGSVCLTLVGGSSKPDYFEQIGRSVTQNGLDDLVRFAGKKARADLVEIYQEHDVLVLPSVWEEPFAITPLEAMGCGLAVVATTTGGSAEIFRDGENSLTFPAGDAEACAGAMSRLQAEPELYERLRRRGMHDVAETFTLEKMIDRIEEDLLSLIQS